MSRSTETSEVFLPPPYEQPHVRRQFDDLIQEVSDVIAPVWPLKDYVAVNPYAGVSAAVHGCAGFPKVFSDCETLMPLDFLRVNLSKVGSAMHEIDVRIGRVSIGRNQRRRHGRRSIAEHR